MSSEQRILRRQGLQQLRRWLEQQEQLQRFRSALDGRDAGTLLALIEGAGDSTYLGRMLRQGRSQPGPSWYEELEQLWQTTTNDKLKEALAPGLNFVSIQVSDQLLRSCQPRPQDLEELAGRGLRTVVNLRSESKASESFCQKLGLLYHHFPVEDDHAPTSEQVDEFLALFPSRAPLLVHCHAGRGRTGTFVSCYRIRQGMPVERALELTVKEVGRLTEPQLAFVKEFR